MPSPKLYGEHAADAGKRAFEAHLGQRFALEQPGQTGWQGGERSPYGVALEVSYPVLRADALIAAAQAAMPTGRRWAPPGALACLEMLAAECAKL